MASREVSMLNCVRFSDSLDMNGEWFWLSVKYEEFSFLSKRKQNPAFQIILLLSAGQTVNFNLTFQET